MKKDSKLKLRKRIFKEKFLWNAPNKESFCKRMRIYTFLNKKWKIKIDVVDNNLFAIDAEKNGINYAFQQRTPFYKDGIKSRLESLLRDYMIDDLEIPKNATIIDCGANIGEIGMGLRLKSASVDYHAFEPSDPEYHLCELNNPLGTNIKAALWRKTEALTFYSKKTSADSSAIEIEDYDAVVTVDAITLEEYCQKNNIQEIFLLKLEAEGAEPEVLEGAVGVLGRIRYITADCGFERGKEKASTAPEVANFLLQRGFEMVGIRKDRVTILFRNKALTGG